MQRLQKELTQGSAAREARISSLAYASLARSAVVNERPAETSCGVSTWETASEP